MFDRIRMFGRNLRAGPRPQVQPFTAGRPPSAGSALYCEQIAYPRAHINTHIASALRTFTPEVATLTLQCAR